MVFPGVLTIGSDAEQPDLLIKLSLVEQLIIVHGKVSLLDGLVQDTIDLNVGGDYITGEVQTALFGEVVTVRLNSTGAVMLAESIVAWDASKVFFHAELDFGDSFMQLLAGPIKSGCAELAGHMQDVQKGVDDQITVLQSQFDAAENAFQQAKQKVDGTSQGLRAQLDKDQATVNGLQSQINDHKARCDGWHLADCAAATGLQASLTVATAALNALKLGTDDGCARGVLGV